MKVVRLVAVLAMAGTLSGCGGLLEFFSPQEPEGQPAEEAPAETPADDAPVAQASIVATMRLIRSQRFLPEALEAREIAVRIEEPVGIAELAGRLADEIEVDVAVEDRPARDGIPVEMGEVAPRPVDETGKVRRVLNRVAMRMGYEWEYLEADEGPRVVFYRHVDARWQERLARIVVQEPEPEPEPSLDVWRIDPARHETVRGVLADWAELAGWTVVWEADDLDYSVTARAVFHGSFEEAVDGLLRDTRGYRALIPTAWRSNRYLTVRVGS